MTVRRYVEYLPLSEIQLAPRNPKGHDAAGINRSMKHHGLGELPLLDDRTGLLVAGHGRHEQLLAMHREGKPAPGGIEVTDSGDWLVPIIRGWRSASDEAAEAYLLGSNQTSINGGWADDRLLAEMLHDAADAQMLELAGWDSVKLEEMLRHSDIVGEHAAAMLTGPPRPDTGDPGEDDDSGQAGQPAPGGPITPANGYVVVSWTVLPGERDIIRAAVHAAQKRFGAETAAKALVALASDYNTHNSEAAA